MKNSMYDMNEAMLKAQIIEDYKYNDLADPDVAIKPKGPWIKENKMTREEAVIKITNVWDSGGSLVDQLEALGLIKFEEKKLTPVELMMKHQHSKDFFIALDKNGYTIVPK